MAARFSNVPPTEVPDPAVSSSSNHRARPFTSARGALDTLGVPGDAARHVPVGGVSRMGYDEVEPERPRPVHFAGEAREGPLPKSEVG